MSDRYVIGRKPKERKKRRRTLLILLIILALLGGCGWWLYKYLSKSNSTITQAKAVVTRIEFDESKTKQFNETNFTIDLPADWVEVRHDTSPYNVYSFQGTTDSSKTRKIDIYEDKIPTNLSFNRVLGIESNGPRVTLRGEASDTCEKYTYDTRTTNNSAVKAKWQGYEFLCDQANLERHVVGTVSQEGNNQITMTSQLGQHRYLFVYTEQSAVSNFSVLYSAISSFELK